MMKTKDPPEDVYAPLPTPRNRLHQPWDFLFKVPPDPTIAKAVELHANHPITAKKEPDMNLPPHKALMIEHNPQFVYYCTVAEYLVNRRDCPLDFIDDADRGRCCGANDLWVLTWYDRTPVGSYQIGASTLERLLELASNYLKEG